MSRSVTIAAGKNNVQLPDGGHYNAGQTVTLTDAQFAQIPSSAIPSTVIDNGAASTPGDQVVTQGADVTNLLAQTSSAPAAITSTAPSAGYVQAEATALRADVVALRATLAAVQVDVVNLRTTVNALDANLTGPGKALA